MTPTDVADARVAATAVSAASCAALPKPMIEAQASRSGQVTLWYAHSCSGAPAMCSVASKATRGGGGEGLGEGGAGEPPSVALAVGLALWVAEGDGSRTTGSTRSSETPSKEAPADVLQACSTRTSPVAVMGAAGSAEPARKTRRSHREEVPRCSWTVSDPLGHTSSAWSVMDSAEPEGARMVRLQRGDASLPTRMTSAACTFSGAATAARASSHSDQAGSVLEDTVVEGVVLVLDVGSVVAVALPEEDEEGVPVLLGETEAVALGSASRD